MVKNMRVARVVARKDFTDDLFTLWLQPEDEEKFVFKPGQYCTIGTYDSKGELVRDSHNKLLLRPYSIVSAPHEDAIELFVELVPPPEGNLTPLLHKLQVGDTVPLLPKAKGVFTLDPEYKNQVMVATVTGIAPFLSMIRDYAHSDKRSNSFFILHGASYRDEFVCDTELQDTGLWTTVSMVYMPSVSRPKEARNKNWVGQDKRVHLIVEECLESWELSCEDTVIYACGHPGMVHDVEEKFGINGKGFKVKAELYWQ